MYSPEFVASVLRRVRIPVDGLIFDPWNGSGTTTSSAWRNGLNALGLDLNPAMVLIAKGRLLGRSDLERLIHIGRSLEALAALPNTPINADDPMLHFFDDTSVVLLRSVEGWIRSHFSVEVASQEGFGWVEKCEPVLACFYVVLFKASRRLFKSFGTSNPTWFKKPPTDGRVSFQWPQFKQLVLDNLTEAIRYVESDGSLPSAATSTVAVSLGDSRQVHHRKERVHLTITSPPYCTRIDYAMATQPELTVLAVNEDALRDLRVQMIGTPTISKSEACLDLTGASPTCEVLLDKVAKHSSYAASRYYMKTFRQYFAGVLASLRGVDIVTDMGGDAVIVVQDSYFKDLRIDLPVIYREFFSYLGWNLSDQMEFKTRTKGAIHRFSSRYRDQAGATESVLIFHKEAI
jgi:hypothetical protein